MQNKKKEAVRVDIQTNDGVFDDRETVKFG
jgi:hypothetical protein